MIYLLGVGEIRGERWSAVAGGETKGNMKAWHRHRGFPMDLSTAMVERMAERTMNYLRNFLATSIWTAPELVIKVPHDARKDMFYHSSIQRLARFDEYVEELFDLHPYLR